MIFVLLGNMFKQRWKECMAWYFLIKISQIRPLRFDKFLCCIIFNQNTKFLFMMKIFSILYQILLCKNYCIINCVAFNCNFIHIDFDHLVSLLTNGNETFLQSWNKGKVVNLTCLQKLNKPLCYIFPKIFAFRNCLTQKYCKKLWRKFFVETTNLHQGL